MSTIGWHTYKIVKVDSAYYIYVDGVQRLSFTDATRSSGFFAFGCSGLTIGYGLGGIRNFRYEGTEITQPQRLLMPNGNVISRYGSPKITAPTGSATRGMYFNGSTDYFTLPYSHRYAITINFWAWIDTSASHVYHAPLSVYPSIASTAYDFTLHLSWTSSRHLYFDYGGDSNSLGGGRLYHSGFSSGFTDKWVMFTLIDLGVYAGYMKAYRNADLVLHDADNSKGGLTTAAPSTLYIAKYSGNYYKGWIGDLRIYNRALTDAEVKALYKKTYRA